MGEPDGWAATQVKVRLNYTTANIGFEPGSKWSVEQVSKMISDDKQNCHVCMNWYGKHTYYQFLREPRDSYFGGIRFDASPMADASVTLKDLAADGLEMTVVR